MYSTPWCGDCWRAKRWFTAHGIPYEEINIDRDPEAAAYVLRVNGGMRSVPTIILPDGSVLVEPDSRPLAAACASAGIQPAAETNTVTKTTRATWSETMRTRGPDVAGHTMRSYPRFAALYNRMMTLPSVQRMFDPWRRVTAGQAVGVVLEVGAGGGQNFPFYDPARVVRVEAIEPDPAMRAVADQVLLQAPVPLRLSSAPAEALPFPDETFDSVVGTLVFCSVQDPTQSLREIWRVLKPGGTLLLLEHVRAQGKATAWVQDVLVPVTTRCMGNCHWNRATEQTVQAAGFQITQLRQVQGGLQPVILLQATRPE
jgi:ubiquinone/menaquinone biosynthesis C-methylase UbiE/glutaredoxin